MAGGPLVLVELTLSVAGQEVTVTIEPGPGGAAAVAAVLEGGCPICEEPLAGDGLCPRCTEEDGRPVRYRAAAVGAAPA
jgi:hypothetical protein